MDVTRVDRTAPVRDPARDRAEVRDVIETWSIARDSGCWDVLAATFHDDGEMRTTWFEGAAADFVTRSRAAFEAGALVQHLLGGSWVRLSGDRAAAQTRMTIVLRTAVHGVVCDVACRGRFHDLMERRHGRWGIVRREPSYEADRLDPVDPTATVALDEKRLAGYPRGCAHLLYAQAVNGTPVRPDDLPELRGPGRDRLDTEAERWLRGEPRRRGSTR